MRLLPGLLKILGIVSGVVAAAIWWKSAYGHLPTPPGASIGTVLPNDPFYIALVHSAKLNQWAALATGFSILFVSIGDLIEWYRRRQNVDR